MPKRQVLKNCNREGIRPSLFYSAQTKSNLTVMGKYFSIRVVDAESPEEALLAVEDGIFDEAHGLADIVIEEQHVHVDSEIQAPNDLLSWAQTHHEVVVAIDIAIGLIDDDETSGRPPRFPGIAEIRETAGTGGFYELGVQLTNEFEMLHAGRQWDGDYFDAVADFVTVRFKEL